MAARAQGDQVILDGFIGDAAITGGPVVDLQRIARSILIAEAATVPIQGKAGGALCGPGRRGDVLLVHHSCPGSGAFSRRAGGGQPFCFAMWHSSAKRISWVIERLWCAATCVICSQIGSGMTRLKRCLSIAQV